MTGQAQMTMNPELVYNLVAANPNLKNLVEQTARLAQLQQQAQQLAPMIQQMAQNPMGAVNGYTDWQQQQAQPPANAPGQDQQTHQGGQTVGMYDQVIGQITATVEEFHKKFETLNNNLKEVYDLCETTATAVKALADKTESAVAGDSKSKSGKQQQNTNNNLEAG